MMQTPGVERRSHSRRQTTATYDDQLNLSNLFAELVVMIASSLS